MPRLRQLDFQVRFLDAPYALTRTCDDVFALSLLCALGYIYPDSFGQGGPCDMYNGTKCTYSDDCCYNTDLWCPGYDGNQAMCQRYDRGSYPYGDQPVYNDQMSNPYALEPFPNGLYWNWATILILGFGNLAALDFQGRCMAAKSPTAARWGCIIASMLTLLIGIPFSYLGAITRYASNMEHKRFFLTNPGPHMSAIFVVSAVYTTARTQPTACSRQTHVTSTSICPRVLCGSPIRTPSCSC